MTKANKNFTLDSGLIEELKDVPNASKLVNDLLISYFNDSGKEAKEEIKATLSGLRKEVFEKKELIIELEDKLEKIKAKEREVENILSDCPKEVIDDFRSFPKMTEDILKNRWNTIYREKYEISYDTVLNAFKVYFKERTAND